MPGLIALSTSDSCLDGKQLHFAIRRRHLRARCNSAHIRLIHRPSIPDGVSTWPGSLGQQRHEPQHPPVHGDVVDLDATLPGQTAEPKPAGQVGWVAVEPVEQPIDSGCSVRADHSQASPCGPARCRPRPAAPPASAAAGRSPLGAGRPAAGRRRLGRPSPRRGRRRSPPVAVPRSPGPPRPGRPPPGSDGSHAGGPCRERCGQGAHQRATEPGRRAPTGALVLSSSSALLPPRRRQPRLTVLAAAAAIATPGSAAWSRTRAKRLTRAPGPIVRGTGRCSWLGWPQRRCCGSVRPHRTRS